MSVCESAKPTESTRSRVRSERKGTKAVKTSPHSSLRAERVTAPVPDECVYKLSAEDHGIVKELLDRQSPLNLRELDDDAAILEAVIGSDALPIALRRVIHDFKVNSNEYGTLLIRGLPTDSNLPPTPNDGGTSSEKRTSYSEHCLLWVMTRLGDPRGYAEEKFGALIQSVSPVRGAESRQENTGSLAFLEFHTEDAFLPEMPDFLGLICLRSDHKGVARTGTAAAKRALLLVSGSTIDYLRQPLYQIRVPSSFTGEDSDQSPWSEPAPVLSGHPLYPVMRIDLDPQAMRATNKRAAGAMAEFADALQQSVVDCVLTPGDLLIVDNKTAAHARSSFEARYDGADRWLQRIKVVVDPRASPMTRRPGSRVCSLALSGLGDPNI